MMVRGKIKFLIKEFTKVSKMPKVIDPPEVDLNFRQGTSNFRHFF
jgi:hypothetical protein